MKNVRKYPFTVSVDNVDDTCIEYMVSFKDFKSIIGSGSTIDEAIEEAYGNLEAYFEYCDEEGIAIPEPSKNNYLDDYSGKITLRMPKSLHRDISELANRDGISLNYIINDAIRFYLSKSSIEELVTDASNYIYDCSLRLKQRINANLDVQYDKAPRFSNMYLFTERDA